MAAILICQKSATLYLPSSTVLFILSVFCVIRDKHINISCEVWRHIPDTRRWSRRAALYFDRPGSSANGLG